MLTKDLQLKMTPQRAAIIGYLKENTSHPSADDIYMAVRTNHPMMSLATVYNTLETLRSTGAVVELSLDRRKKRYDPVTAPHAHLVCTACGKVEDISGFNVKLPPALARGYRITGAQTEFYGLCPECGNGGHGGPGNGKGDDRMVAKEIGRPS